MDLSNYNIIEALKLVKSLVILYHPNAMSNNIELVKQFGNSYVYDINDFRTLKYYINMTGEYHELDNRVYPDGILCNILETNETKVLTKSLLEQYPLTKQELRLQDSYYRSLITKYPFSETLIKGIVYPTTMEDIENSEDGKILDWNRDSIEPQEYNLIEELEFFITAFFRRWSISKYTYSDDMYAGSVMATLTPLLIQKIVNTRLQNIGSSKVHSFFMNAYFNSNLKMSDDANRLPDDVKMWLYKNLKFLIKHTGKEENILLLIDKILEKVGVDVKEYIVKKNIADSELSDTLKIVPYSNVKDRPSVITISDVVDNELCVRESTEKEMEKIKIPKLMTERTKLISLDYVKTGKIFPLNRAVLIFESWLYKIFNSNSVSDDTYGKFIDPNTNVKYIISEKIAGYLVIKWLFTIYGYENRNIEKFILQSIPRNTFNDENLLSNSSVVDDMRTILSNTYDNINYNNEFNKTIDAMIDFYNRTWLYINDENNPIIRSDGELILERIFAPRTIRVSDEPKVIDDIFTDPIKYVNDYNYRKSINDLIYCFTDLNIDRIGKIDELLGSFVNILTKLVSYTTQIITKTDYPLLYITNDELGDLRGTNKLVVNEGTSVSVEPLVYDVTIETLYNSDNNYDIDVGLGKAEVDEPLPNSFIAAYNKEAMEAPFKTTIKINYVEDSKKNTFTQDTL